MLHFFLGAICSIGSILWSIKTTSEIPPSNEEIAEMKSKKGFFTEPIIEIFFRNKSYAKSDVAIGLSLYVSMVCFILLLAKFF